ncbi:hypothetical protein EsH8_VIII_000938 [Colletotrichum jinshuiense]
MKKHRLENYTRARVVLCRDTASSSRPTGQHIADIPFGASFIPMSNPETYRCNFLSGFTAEVDTRFLPLTGFMYLIKQIDYANTASVKNLQVGKPQNILTEQGSGI